MLVLDTPVPSVIKQRDDSTPDTPVPPEPQERFDPGEGPKTLFICASSTERCQDMLDYIDVAIDDIKSKVRVIFCTQPAALDTQILPVITAGVSRIAGICIRHHELDSDGFFEVFTQIVLRLLGPSPTSHERQVSEFFLTLIRCSYSSDVPLSSASQRKFQDAFLDLHLAHPWLAKDLENIFSSQRLVDLSHPKFGNFIRLIIGARIRGEL